MRHACFVVAVSSILASLCCLALPSPAAAGPVEQLVQVALHPGDPDTMLLRYKAGGEGLFVTHDGGKTWALICNSFIDPSISARNGAAAVGGDGALFLGVFDGLWQADDGGCGWQITEGVGPRWVTDAVSDPSDPEVTYAVTANGGEGVLNGILKREAGDSWSELGDQEEIMIFRMRVVSTGEGLRFVQGATRGQLPRTLEDGVETTVPNYVIRVSDDGAESFQEFPYEAPPDGSWFLAEVDPSNPDRIVAYNDRDETTGKDDPVLVSLDGGQSFETYLEVADFGGVTITAAGRVYIADRGSLLGDKPKGLWTADSLEDVPTALHTDRGFGCLGSQAATDTVFACELRSFGTVDQASGEYTPLMQFDEVQSLVECEGVDMAMACQTQLCRDYCITGHFPQTPLCEVYQSPSCGPCNAVPPTAACQMGAAGSGAAGTSGAAGGNTAGAGTSGNAGMGAAAGGAAAGSGEAGAGVTGGGAGSDGGGDDGDKGGSGCACASVGARSHGSSATIALLALALGVLARGRGARFRKR